MKSTAAFRHATRTIGKLLFAAFLLVIAAVVGFGGTALFVYHQFGDARRPSAQQARGATADRPSAARSVAEMAMPNLAKPQYMFVANTGGQPVVAAGRQRPTTNVPAPLAKTAPVGAVAEAGGLNDADSHYIVDSRGRVIGIDGSEGARREAAREQVAESSQPPSAIAVPTPEVRVASAVVEDGQPVFDGDGAPRANLAGAQYLPVRKALPVTAEETSAPARNFNVGEYLRNTDGRPVLRAQAVVPSSTRVVKTVRIDRLADGSQTLAAD